jgi:predicted transcriptional regulator
MNTASISSTKTTTSFRLNAELVQRLRSLAKRNNRSLNNYIETILFDFAYSELNDETIEAINEARSGKRLDRFDMAELDNMISKL